MAQAPQQSFEASDFNHQAYINDLLRAPLGESETLDQRITATVLRLQLSCQQLSAQLDDAVDEALRGMPRTLQDLEFMKKDTGALKETVDVVRLQLSAADARTSDVIATLRQLDLVKDRMDTSLRVIREADNWNSLAAEIDSVLVSGDVQRAVERLREMERSLELMQRLPEYGQRKEQLTRAQNKFYASLSPQLVSAFAEQDMERCVSLYAVFKESRKESDFLDYYIKVRREPVVRQWAASHTAGGADAQATPARVTSLLEAIMDLTTNETAWCREVFSDPSRVTAMLAANIIGVLDPPLPSLLKECPLPLVSKCWAAVLEHAQGMARLFRVGEAGPFEALERYLVVLFKSFADVHQRFDEYALKQLKSTFVPAGFKAATADDNLQQWADVIAKLSSSVEEATALCQTLTLGYRTEQCAAATDAFVAFVVEKLEAVLKALSAMCADKEAAAAPEPQWMPFQTSLRFLGLVHSLSKRVDKMEDVLRRRLLSARDNGSGSLGRTPSDACESFAHSVHAAVSKELPGSDGAAELSGLARPESKLLGGAREAVSAFGVKAQRLVYDTLLRPLEAQLSTLPSLPGVWDAPSAADKADGNAPSIPMFSVAPSSVITAIGEYLLDLTNSLDEFSSDEAMAFRVDALPHVAPSAGDGEGEVIARWVQAVAQGLLEMYVASVLKIRKLSEAGRNQLSADLRYLANVLGAVDAAPSAEFAALVRWTGVPVAEWAAATTANEVEKRVLTRLQAMR